MLIFSKKRDISKNAIVITAEIIWFSVMLEANIPTDIAAVLIKINPSIEVKTGIMLVFAKKETIA